MSCCSWATTLFPCIRQTCAPEQNLHVVGGVEMTPFFHCFVPCASIVTMSDEFPSQAGDHDWVDQHRRMRVASAASSSLASSKRLSPARRCENANPARLTSSSSLMPTMRAAPPSMATKDLASLFPTELSCACASCSNRCSQPDVPRDGLLVVVDSSPCKSSPSRLGSEVPARTREPTCASMTCKMHTNALGMLNPHDDSGTSGAERVHGDALMRMCAGKATTHNNTGGNRKIDMFIEPKLDMTSHHARNNNRAEHYHKTKKKSGRTAQVCRTRLVHRPCSPAGSASTSVHEWTICTRDALRGGGHVPRDG